MEVWDGMIRIWESIEEKRPWFCPPKPECFCFLFEAVCDREQNIVLLLDGGQTKQLQLDRLVLWEPFIDPL